MCFIISVKVEIRELQSLFNVIISKKGVHPPYGALLASKIEARYSISVNVHHVSHY